MTNRQNSDGAGVIFRFGLGKLYCRGCYYGRGFYYDLIPTPKKAIEECQMPIITHYIRMLSSDWLMKGVFF
jgi:hypothetical protein